MFSFKFMIFCFVVFSWTLSICIFILHFLFLIWFSLFCVNIHQFWWIWICLNFGFSVFHWIVWNFHELTRILKFVLKFSYSLNSLSSLNFLIFLNLNLHALKRKIHKFHRVHEIPKMWQIQKNIKNQYKVWKFRQIFENWWKVKQSIKFTKNFIEID